MTVGVDDSVLILQGEMDTFVVSPDSAVEGSVIVISSAGPRGPRGFSGDGALRQNVELLEEPDDSRVIFTSPSPYESGSLAVYLNGLQEFHVAEISSTQFEFEAAPWTGAEVRISYMEAAL